MSRLESSYELEMKGELSSMLQRSERGLYYNAEVYWQGVAGVGMVFLKVQGRRRNEE